MKIELILDESPAKYSNLEIIINDKSVGAIQIADENLGEMIFRLIGKAKITSI